MSLLLPWAGASCLCDGFNNGITVLGATSSGQVWTVIGWFRVYQNTASNFANIYAEGVTTDTSMLTIQMKNASTQGQLKFFFRPAGAATASMTISSTNAYDDGLWHWYVAQRTADNAHALYVDGTAQGTDSTSITTTYPSGTSRLVFGANSLPAGSKIGPHWSTRQVLPIELCRLIAYGLAPCPNPALRLDAIWSERMFTGGPPLLPNTTGVLPVSADHPFPIRCPSLRYARASAVASGFKPWFAANSNQILGWGSR